jgi:hypothetical protein
MFQPIDLGQRLYRCIAVGKQQHELFLGKQFVKQMTQMSQKKKADDPVMYLLPFRGRPVIFPTQAM